MIKKYEFWHPRLFELPFYLYLGAQCLVRGLSIKSLAKANYALDHGEIGIGSKYQTQLAFDQKHFPPTRLIRDTLPPDKKGQEIKNFAEQHGFPLILKPDMGCVGKGVTKISSQQELDEKVHLLCGDYILQEFVAGNEEYGIFYIRHRGLTRITGINRKHFPTVTGNGTDTVHELARRHDRYSHHWDLFLQYFDKHWMPEDEEKVQLSFIGSHTMGCKFTDDSHLLTPQLEEAVFAIFGDQPGVNFSRIDVKAESETHFQNGDFVVMEVNGVPSLPTHMFDPRYNVRQAYKIFLEHAKWLVLIAQEHKNKEMELTSYREIIRRVKINQGLLNQAHGQLLDDASV